LLSLRTRSTHTQKATSKDKERVDCIAKDMARAGPSTAGNAFLVPQLCCNWYFHQIKCNHCESHFRRVGQEGRGRAQRALHVYVTGGVASCVVSCIIINSSITLDAQLTRELTRNSRGSLVVAPSISIIAPRIIVAPRIVAFRVIIAFRIIRSRSWRFRARPDTLSVRIARVREG